MERIKIKKDIYVCRRLDEFVIINDDYNGLIILDKNLRKLYSIRFSQELIISDIYCDHLSRKCLINCVENECFVIVDICEKKATTIKYDFDINKHDFGHYFICANNKWYLYNTQKDEYCIWEDNISASDNDISKRVKFLYEDINVFKMLNENKYLNVQNENTVIRLIENENVTLEWILQDSDFIDIDYVENKNAILILYEKYLLIIYGDSYIKIENSKLEFNCCVCVMDEEHIIISKTNYLDNIDILERYSFNELTTGEN